MRTPLQPAVCPALGTPPRLRRNVGSVSHDGPANVSAKSESPFAFSGRYPSKGDVNHHLGDRYATVFAPTGSCARSIALPRARFYTRPSGLCRSLSSPAGHRSFPTLSLQIFPWMSGPLPRRYSKVLLLVSSLGSSAFPRFEIGRLHQPWPARRLLCGLAISGLQAFSNVQTSRFARHPGRSHRCGFIHHRAAVAFTSGHRTVSLLPYSGYASRLNRAIDGRGLSPPRFAALSAAPQTLRPASHEHGRMPARCLQ